MHKLSSLCFFLFMIHLVKVKIMKYQELVKEVEGVRKLKLSEQENFYRDVLNESSNDLEVMVAATFYLGMTFYYEGNFNKAKEIIEPIILQYQSMHL